MWNNAVKIYFLSMLVCAAIFTYCFFHNPDHQDWIDAVHKHCTVIKQGKGFEYENFEKTFGSYGIVGAYLGSLLEDKVLNTSKYRRAHEVSVGKTLKRIGLTYLMGIPQLIMYITIDKHKNHYFFVLVAKYFLPAFMANINSFGMLNYISEKCGLINIEEEKEKEN